MSAGTPDNTGQVEDRIKADVQREAPDSNPYLRVHWLRSLIAGISRRIFDFYQDLARTEKRLFPDTADDEAAVQWGGIYIGQENPASQSSGIAVATGSVGSPIGIGEQLSSGGEEYATTSSAVISAQVINASSITRSGTTASVTTAGDHNLASAVPVTIAGASEPEYNIVDTEIVVTGLDSFTYQVAGSPSTPATGTITAAYDSAAVDIESAGFGASTNLDADSPLALQSPLAGIDDTLNVSFGAIGGGTDQESLPDYKSRYLDKIRNPVAHFNESDIAVKAKEVPGVTRVFVEPAGTEIGTIAVSSITRSGNVATVVTASAHGLDDGQETSILGAAETDYNVTDSRIIIEDSVTFHYVVTGSPTTPATGSITAATSIALGQVRTFFMRDNDDNPIPSASEVQDVKDALDSIKPANTASSDNIVKAPTAVVVAYVFTSITPDTPTMREAIEQNIAQFHDEQTTVGVDVDEDAYRAAIKNTVDPDTGDIVLTFTLSSPSGDISISSGEIATKGTVTF